MTTETPVLDKPATEAKQTLAEVLWGELSEHEQPIRLGAHLTDEYLESLRGRIITGDLPEFITTDYREGWYRYARSEVADRLIAAFATIQKRRRRQFIPTTLAAGGPWGEAEQQDEETIVEYSLARLTKHVASAVFIHGAPLGDLRGFEFARNVAHKAVDDAFDKLGEDTAETA